MHNLLISIVFCLAAGLLQAAKPLPEFRSIEGPEINVAGTVPDGFRLLEEDRFWKLGSIWNKNFENGTWERCVSFNGIGGPALQSDDKQCEILLNLSLLPMPKEDHYGHYPFYPWWLHYRNIMMYDLMAALDRSDDIRLEDYVTGTGGETARRAFNADSVFVCRLPIKPLVQDGETYTHCHKMYLWKKGKSMVYMAWFFTDEGEKRKKEYFEKLNTHIWFKDEE